MIASRVWLLPVTVLCLAIGGWPRPRRARSTRRAEPVVRVAAASAGSIYGVVLDEAGVAGGRRGRSRRSAGRPPSRSPIAPASTDSRSCRPGPTWCAPIAKASPARAARWSTSARGRARRRRSPCAAPMPSAEGAWPPVSAWSTADRGIVAARRERSGVAAAPAEAQRAQGRDRARASTFDAADDDWLLEDSIEFLGRAFESSARLASSLFTDVPALRPVQPADRHGLRRRRRVRRLRPAVGGGVLRGGRPGRPPRRLGGPRRHEQRRRHRRGRWPATTPRARRPGSGSRSA